MNFRNGIFLTGLAGSGKSTLGKSLAKRLGYKFIDLDTEIEKKEGMTIPEVFKRFGEGQFRIFERETLHQLIAVEDHFVLATGGGTPCYHFNMDAMNEAGMTVYLDVAPGDLALRIIEEGVESRPMFKSYDHVDLIQEIREMKARREEYYELAKIKIRDNQISVEMIISKINESKD
ncbi:shikimate kinase [Roseivirga sp. E12]|uniref:shikimate kinase n=1 Tax=Roseivirga sp. E12 TaxID=2819237 RepID=UPI001ABCD053|nr:shikimate kinase [Roseivirga sp. E12]MBO3700791.1 shikimate kinase [Roseivirga sp. E12]